MLTLRPVQPGDDCSGLGAVHGPDLDGPRKRRTFVAELEGAVAGAATLMWSSRHPDVVAATIDVEPRARRRGVGTSLLRLLETEAGAPVMANVERSVPASAFLRSVGFDVVVTSNLSRLEVQRAVVALADAPMLDPSIQLTASDTLPPDVVARYERIYAARHVWAGRYVSPPDAPWIAFAGPLLAIDGAVHTARRAGVPIAVASLHGGPFAAGADAFVPPTSVLDGPLDQRVALLRALLGLLLRAAAAAGIATIIVEHDTPYDDLHDVVRSLGAADISTRDVWMRAAGSA